MHNPTLIKTYLALSAVAAMSLVTVASETEVTSAVDGAAFLLGVSDPGADVALGGRVDVITDGFAEVTLGGDVAVGDPITADASGKAVKAAPAAGEQIHIIGFAVLGGELDDIGAVKIAPQILTGV